MWVYAQENGQMHKDTILVDTGYSGHGDGLNNPDMENVPDVGPIPCGDWTIEGPPKDSPTHGPYTLRLEPSPKAITYGRSGFLIHGDEKEHPGMNLASHGCIILPRATRSRIWQSGDTLLNVRRSW